MFFCWTQSNDFKRATPFRMVSRAIRLALSMREIRLAHLNKNRRAVGSVTGVAMLTLCSWHSCLSIKNPTGAERFSFLSSKRRIRGGSEGDTKAQLVLLGSLQQAQAAAGGAVAVGAAAPSALEAELAHLKDDRPGSVRCFLCCSRGAEGYSVCRCAFRSGS